MQYITEYNYDWTKRFVHIVEYLKEFVPTDCQFHHIGSTSVPGMPAKDIIDLNIEYVESTLEQMIDALGKAGYKHEGDQGIKGREVFKRTPISDAKSLPAHHLYVCEAKAVELLKHLTFRDYLIAHPDRMKWLAVQKIEADASALNKGDYIEKKSPFYAIIAKESMEWAGRLV